MDSPSGVDISRNSPDVSYSVQLRNIYTADTPEGKILRFALNSLVENTIDEVVSLTAFNMRKLSLITRNTELRWLLVNKRLMIKCPSCGNELKSNCARYKCFQCDQTSMIHSLILTDICESCASFKKSCQGPGHNLMSPIVSINR